MSSGGQSAAPARQHSRQRGSSRGTGVCVAAVESEKEERRAVSTSRDQGEKERGLHQALSFGRACVANLDPHAFTYASFQALYDYMRPHAWSLNGATSVDKDTPAGLRLLGSFLDHTCLPLVISPPNLEEHLRICCHHFHGLPNRVARAVELETTADYMLSENYQPGIFEASAYVRTTLVSNQMTWWSVYL